MRSLSDRFSYHSTDAEQQASMATVLYEQRIENANGEHFIHVCRTNGQRVAHPEGETIPEDHILVCHEDPIGFIAVDPTPRLLSRTEFGGYIEVRV